MADGISRASTWPASLLGYDLTLSTATMNLALDEALLAAVDADPAAGCLRFWQPTEYFVVLGRSNRADTEVDIDACEAERVPIFRRASGGGAVVLGSGCLCYTLALPLTDGMRASGVTCVTAELMERCAAGLRVVLPGVEVMGTSDLVVNGRKFSGNAQRWSRRSFLHQGTLLFDFDLSLFPKLLSHPSREPAYRRSRPHSDFVTNVSLSPAELRESLLAGWNAHPATCSDAVIAEARLIEESRYGSSDWRL